MQTEVQDLADLILALAFLFALHGSARFGPPLQRTVQNQWLHSRIWAFVTLGEEHLM